MISKKYKKVCRVFNCIEHLLILDSTVIECISISTLASLVGIPVGITSSAVGLEICVITTGIKTINQQIRKRKKKQYKLVF